MTLESADDLIDEIRHLSPLQREQVRAVVAVLTSTRVDYLLNPQSDFATDAFAAQFGALLVMHHAFSGEAFTKDKFEHALVRVMKQMGSNAALAPRGNAGHDATVGEQRWSLKTQADSNIDANMLHISKFMELGRGQWASEADLPGLRDRMLTHMEAYDRILDLRCLSSRPGTTERHVRLYELVEIPKDLLRRAQTGAFEMVHSSRQNPKPGYCRVFAPEGHLLFELYFDGGTERKLQIRKLRKDACVVHATWHLTGAAD